MLFRGNPQFDVVTAPDPIIASQKIAGSRPDVIVLDLEMPRMDGITFLQHIMSSDDPIPVVICSGLAERGSELAMKTLELGAVEVIAKPRFGVRDFIADSEVLISDALRAAAASTRRFRRAPPAIPPSPRLSADAILPPARPAIRITTDRVVAIGASTGGTEALRVVLAGMPPDAPGTVIVQHMPEVFTAAFAKRLNDECRVEVKEAVDGDRISDGRALIAPGNRHLLVQRDGAHYVARVVDGPLVSRHRPSADVLFRSVAQSAGPNAVGVIMTGMGNDGSVGLFEMREAGAMTIAQDEATSVVFGMPKEAIARGAVQQVVPLPAIANAILRRAR